MNNNQQIEEHKSVNWNQKNWFLTYAQSEFTREGLAAFLLGRFKPYVVRKWVIAVEQHQDGGIHYHALFCLLSKCHTRDTRFLDYSGKHPNVKTVGGASGDVERVYYYIIKGGDYIEEWSWYDGPLDYRRRKGDVQEFTFDIQMGNRRSPFPFKRPDEIIEGGNFCTKCRHLWFYGPPDWGKTSWVNSEFDGRSIYMRPAEDLYPYEGYRGEELVIFDDVYPTGKEEICGLSNTWRVPMQVFGKTRYTRLYWPIGVSRLIVVLANDRPKWEGEVWFDSRFQVVRLR